MMIFDFLEVPWGLGRLPWVPGAVAEGVWGSNNPQLKVWEVTFLGFFIAQNHVVFDVDFWSFWARSWAPSWGSFSVILAPWSAKVGPKAVFEPS